jgi:cell division septation protein DedD
MVIHEESKHGQENKGLSLWYLGSRLFVRLRINLLVQNGLTISSGVVFTIVRIPFLGGIAHPVDNGWFKATQSAAVTTAIEIALGIICFCLTACKPLFRSFYCIAAAYTQRVPSQNRSRNRSIALVSQDIEKSAHTREEGITRTPSEDYEAESSSSPCEFGAITETAVPAVVINNHRDSGVVDSNLFRKQPKARRESDNISMSDDQQCRMSRIRSSDMRFYGIFNRADKPPTVISETNTMSPVSTRDMRFYGVDKMRFLPEIVSDTSHEVVRSEQQDVMTQIPVISTKPTLPSIRTRDMSVDANGMPMPGPLSHHPVEED